MLPTSAFVILCNQGFDGLLVAGVAFSVQDAFDKAEGHAIRHGSTFSEPGFTEIDPTLRATGETYDSQWERKTNRNPDHVCETESYLIQEFPV